MHFSLGLRWYPPAPLRLPSDAPVKFEFGGPNKVVVGIRKPEEEEKTPDFLKEYREIICTARGIFVPTRKAVPIFESLATGHFPASCLPLNGSDHSIGPDGEIPDGIIPPLAPLPESFKDYINSVRSVLKEYAIRTMRNLRWYMGSGGVEIPQGDDALLMWSLDGETWHPQPWNNPTLEITVRFPPPLTAEIRDAVTQLTSQGANEPLGHQLYLEAEDQSSNNPRGALLLAISALEVGFKECVSDLVPDAQWLAFHAPTPPLKQMLGQYLPLLPARCKFDGKVLPPPEDLLTTIQNGVTMRNTLAHSGRFGISEKALGEVLAAVRDVLYLLDYYRGHPWALKLIRKPVQAGLRT